MRYIQLQGYILCSFSDIEAMVSPLRFCAQAETPSSIVGGKGHKAGQGREALVYQVFSAGVSY